MCPGGMCPGGKCPGGKRLGGMCPWGKCQGGTCPGGTCPGGSVLSPSGIRTNDGTYTFNISPKSPILPLSNGVTCQLLEK